MPKFELANPCAWIVLFSTVLLFDEERILIPSLEDDPKVLIVLLETLLFEAALMRTP